MTAPPTVIDFWARFAAAVPGIDASRFGEHFCFGDNEGLADDLAALVLAGTKRATANLVWSFEATGQRLRVPGDLRIVTTWNGSPVCVIETTQVQTLAFDDVSAEFAAIEGEGDGTLAYWRWGHTNYFGRECARLQRPFSGQMLVACERFKVIYPLAAGAQPAQVPAGA